MRFKEFLLEREIQTFESTIAQIKKRCAHYLKASRGLPLYRGVPGIDTQGGEVKKFDSTVAYFNAHPQHRRARHSGKEFNFMFNAGCDLAFNVQNIRRKSVFATGSLEQAAAYGIANFFFPVGNYKFISSPLIHDSLENSGRIYSLFMEELDEPTIINNKTALLGHFGNANAEFQGDSHEWALDKEDEKVKAALKKTFAGLYDHNENLAKHIEKGNEILFYETGGFYMIPVKMVINKMNERGFENIGAGDDERIADFIHACLSGSIQL